MMIHTMMSPFLSVAVETTEERCAERYVQMVRLWYDFLDKNHIGRHEFHGILAGNVARYPDNELLARSIEEHPVLLKDIWFRCTPLTRYVTSIMTDQCIDEMLMNHQDLAQLCLKADAALFIGRLHCRHLTATISYAHLERLFFMLAATPTKPLLISLVAGYDSERCREMLQIISSSTYPSSVTDIEEILDESLTEGRSSLRQRLGIDSVDL